MAGKGAGSLGYAERLSHRDDVGGRLGDPELLDAGDAASCPKMAQLVQLVRDAKRIVVHTGAGISTSAGIPDFRGPNGIWTLQKKGAPLPQASVPFDRARPTLTHQALLALHQAGKLAYLVSCNVDCLHLRGGFPRDALAELHGNCFAERCEDCGVEAVRDFEQATVGFKVTGRRCAVCGGRTRDQVLDWDDALPPAELAAAEAHSRAADLTLTLGTSLQIHPACDLPLLTVKAGGRLAIVNLQRTPKDSKAALLLRRRADEVMRHVCAGLGLRIPPFVRRDALRACHVARNGSAAAGYEFALTLCSRHGERCAVPWLEAVELSFPNADAAPLPGRGARAPQPLPAGAAWRLSGPPPWRVRCRTRPSADSDADDESAQAELPTVRVALRLLLAEGCTEHSADVLYHAALGAPPAEAAEGTLVWVKTVEVHYDEPTADVAAAEADAPALKRARREEEQQAGGSGGAA